MGLESYLAVCLRAADGTHLGHMAVMDAGPMEAEDDDVDAMRIFGFAGGGRARAPPSGDRVAALACARDRSRRR
jgi:hypothetical protein